MPTAGGGGSSAITSANIVDNEIVNEDISPSAAIESSKVANEPYEQLAYATLGAGATSLASGTFTAKKHLRILFYIAGNAGGADLGIRFNGDTGNNYLWNTAKDQGAITVSGSLDKLKLSSGGITQERLAIIDIYNALATNKLVRITVVGSDDVWEGGGQWTNTAAQITSITAMLDAAGDITAGSNMTVLGMD